MASKHVLVTGATGLIGAHIVDNLLARGIRVRAVARSKSKADRMLKSRGQFSDLLEFHYIDDLTSEGIFDDSIQGIDGVIHAASPLNYGAKDNEKELILPAIQGVQSILSASAKDEVKRVVMTSSFGAVLDMDRDLNEPYTYSSRDWNPITYKTAADPSTTPQDAYRGSKVFAEQEAWRFVKEKKPSFDLVTLCPSMVFGPVADPINSPNDLNESNAVLWRVASAKLSDELPPARFNFWIDVRDLAEIHVRALLSPEAGGKRYIPVSPEDFTYHMASEIIREEFPSLAKRQTSRDPQEIKTHIRADISDIAHDFPNIKYKTFRETVVDLIKQDLQALHLTLMEPRNESRLAHVAFRN